MRANSLVLGPQDSHLAPAGQTDVAAPPSRPDEADEDDLLESGDEALICIHGVFGARMTDIAERCGAKVIKVTAPWGEPIDPEEVRMALKTCKPKIVAIVQAETSTGVLQPLEEISKMAQEAGVKKLGLVHIGPHLSSHGPMEKGIGEIESLYDGEVIFSDELMSFSI